ncbi:PhoX family phosphatase [Pseudarthrobacter sp. J75]|uniref:PhoX family protein n=1 Tax=unclassified Pseudarthrobacter TaxID=2647000 RepID=UPI002E803432|nr:MULTISPECIES: PhoX family phosphatase [unclassified Pseudarthrobacter]MEE2523975.1 PhoX family phosphatase [Pseudarthrobacter sp. J47]MEE2528257.1 PhoX family phosphatase [Pseudarthrobacter sp. J75]MEE2567959.1 PhoX family phosphatase [Pseudarthrobacter sp. J64]
MAQHVRGKRSPVTCALKCGNACAGPECNSSSNSYFRDIAERAISRRAALGLGLAGALTLAFTGPGATRAEALAPAAKVGRSKLSFQPIAPVAGTVDAVSVPEGFDWDVVIRWGDPLFADSPAFDPAHQTPESQAAQFGYNNDYSDILELPGSKGRRAVLFANHEYTNPELMFSAEDLTADPARARAVSRAGHGLSVVELQRKNKNDPWQYVQGAPLNRRFLMETPYAFTGPAAGFALLRTVTDPAGTTPLGTLNNCSGGTTPWGTILSGEENCNFYFRAPGTSDADKRYGFKDEATAQGWELDDPRWDTRQPGHENEGNRFGWVVEVDPFDPTSTPKKHTSLGRLKHEGANIQIAANGKAVAYTGDDERFEYLYKFVSDDVYVEGNRAHNMTLLHQGNLYVAEFSGDSGAEIDGSGQVPSDGSFDGTGRWLPLVLDGESAVPGMSLDEVLVFTRLAADKAGATKMDRPEDVQPHPVTGKVYVACTNNTDRGKAGKEGATEVNPRLLNRDGHIVEITEDNGDQTATTFSWNLLLVAGDPANDPTAYFSGFPADQVSPISCPDNLAFDSAGNLWVSTDGAAKSIGYNDGLFKVTLDGPERGKVEQFLSVPRGAETCGPIIHDDERHVFVSVQHPGEEGTFEAPLSLFPDYVGAGETPPAGAFRMPRPSVIQVSRVD